MKNVRSEFCVLHLCLPQKWDLDGAGVCILTSQLYYSWSLLWSRLRVNYCALHFTLTYGDGLERANVSQSLIMHVFLTWSVLQRRLGGNKCGLRLCPTKEDWGKLVSVPQNPCCAILTDQLRTGMTLYGLHLSIVLQKCLEWLSFKIHVILTWSILWRNLWVSIVFWNFVYLLRKRLRESLGLFFRTMWP